MRSDDTFLTSEAAAADVGANVISSIETAVEEAGADGVIVAMSGGIDSTLTTALAIEALGNDRVVGLGLPCNKSDALDVNDARTIAKGMGIEYREVHLRPLVGLFTDTIAPAIGPHETSTDAGPPSNSNANSRPESESGAESAFESEPGTGSNSGVGPIEERRAIGNLVARLRMCCLYYAANRSSHLVLGTANRSERLLGYFTKYGDGAADLYPIGDLYKTEVRALAKHLGLPKRIVGKEPTAGFWASQTDADELGASYDEIDPFLERLVDRNEDVETAAQNVRLDYETAREIADRYRRTQHKRMPTSTPGVGGR
ncbi:NAD(+) synthase [Halobacteria archaeon AArc-m2/3/4]|uniref:NH(3)-dependent NAD(+) synthetase n=1 Tax=Natronoglomus mannanivorans TaxID=2979990 RepID=A0ABT2QFP3_9EURY|nr:NAD(+) synthase [Halobacteria archaeon AArc-m2/3/4]